MRDFICKKIGMQTEGKRRGIVRVISHGGSSLNLDKQYQLIWEVEEVTCVNGLSKVKVTGFSQTQETLPEWVETQSIEWINQ